MNKEQLKIFYKLDAHYYLVHHNPVLQKILDTLDSEYKEHDIQAFIDKLIAWYSIKFSDKLLDSILNHQSTINVGDRIDSDFMNYDKLQNNYTSFEEELFQESSANDAKVVLQKYLITMAGWGLIYRVDSRPEYGYYRACQLLNDFNSIYAWNLSPSIYKETLDKDYSSSNPEIIELLELKKREKKVKSPTKKRFLKIRTLFRR